MQRSRRRSGDNCVESEDARCVEGCYRCLLSYYNQPDHELIDRTNDSVRSLLLQVGAEQGRDLEAH